MGKIKCYNCKEVFEKKIPLYEGSFPIYRICPKCKTMNYLNWLDNGKTNIGMAFEETTQNGYLHFEED